MITIGSVVGSVVDGTGVGASVGGFSVAVGGSGAAEDGIEVGSGGGSVADAQAVKRESSIKIHAK